MRYTASPIREQLRRGQNYRVHDIKTREGELVLYWDVENGDWVTLEKMTQGQLDYIGFWDRDGQG